MERPQYLIDTNAVIDYLGKNIPTSGMKFMNGIVDAIPNVSVVAKIEVLGFNVANEHYQMLTNFMNDATVFDLTNNIVDASILFVKNIKLNSPMPSLPLPLLCMNLL